MNTPTLPERIFGANWRTSLSGIGATIFAVLTFLAAVPYELGDVATLIDPDFKATLFKISLFATAILRVINSYVSKDKAVAGNGSDSDPNKVSTESGGNRIIPLVMILLIPALFVGCTLSSEAKARWKATGSAIGSKAAGIATRIILNAAISQVDRENKEDFLHSAANGLRTEMLSIVDSRDIEKVVDIWTPEKPHWGDLAQELAELYAKNPPKTDAEKKAVIEKIASGLQQAAEGQKTATSI